MKVPLAWRISAHDKRRTALALSGLFMAILLVFGERKVTIGGQYVLGTGFMGLGVVLASAANFARLFPGRGLDIVNLGVIELKSGVDPDRAAGALRKVIGPGAQIFTHRELETHETAY